MQARKEVPTSSQEEPAAASKPSLFRQTLRRFKPGSKSPATKPKLKQSRSEDSFESDTSDSDSDQGEGELTGVGGFVPKKQSALLK